MKILLRIYEFHNTRTIESIVGSHLPGDDVTLFHNFGALYLKSFPLSQILNFGFFQYFFLTLLDFCLLLSNV